MCLFANVGLRCVNPTYMLPFLSINFLSEDAVGCAVRTTERTHKSLGARSTPYVFSPQRQLRIGQPAFTAWSRNTGSGFTTRGKLTSDNNGKSLRESE